MLFKVCLREQSPVACSADPRFAPKNNPAGVQGLAAFLPSAVLVAPWLVKMDSKTARRLTVVGGLIPSTRHASSHRLVRVLTRDAKRHGLRVLPIATPFRGKQV